MVNLVFFEGVYHSPINYRVTAPFFVLVARIVLRLLGVPNLGIRRLRFREFRLEWLDPLEVLGLIPIVSMNI